MGKKVAIVGGGAAGMMAAAAAAARGHQVTIYEKNEKLGKKLFITGKGRCNLTNACEVEDLFRNTVSNPKFLYSAIYSFDNTAVQAFFEEAGCPLKTERGGRVFPVSDHSSDVIRALERILRQRQVQICLQTKVVEILKKDNAVTGIRLEDGSRVLADAVILACGGLSYPVTGSNGDGFSLARQAGHTVTECVPALVPLETAEDWCASLPGLALRNVEAVLWMDGKEVSRGFGEMLFTHYGISGPLILSASSYYAAALRKYHAKEEKAAQKKRGQTAAAKPNEKKKPTAGPEAVLYLDLKPALSAEQLDKRILRDFEANKNRQFKNAIDGLFPSRLTPVMLSLSGIDPEKKVHEITREERQQFCMLIKHLPLHITGTRDFVEAIITQGGVKVTEINPSTMESKLLTGLYLTGEMLDVDALTGGFNLQIAWSTGFLAGDSVENL